MTGKYFRIFCLLFYSAIFYGIPDAAGHDVDVMGFTPSMTETIFDTFNTIIDMSNNFERFPLNDSYIDLHFKRLTNSTEKPSTFHDVLLGVLADYGVSTGCRDHILEMNKGLEKNVDWAVRMIDSFGKPEAGLIDLKFKWLGQFDECMTSNWFADSLNAHGYFFNTTNSDVVPQYCASTVPVPFSLVPESSSHLVRKWLPPEVMFGGCFPDTCSETDVGLIVRTVADHIQGSKSEMPVKVVCQKPRSFSTGAIILIIFLCLLGVMLAIGTTYDAVYMRMKLFSKDKSPDETLHLNELDANGEIKATSEKDTEYTNVETVANEANGDADEIIRNHESANYDGDDSGKLRIKIEMENTTDSVKPTTEQEPEGSLHILLMSFSVIKNSEIILNTNVSRDRVNALEGIRALSMAWIIVIHILMFGVYQSGNMNEYVHEKMSDLTFMPLVVSFGVETFFTITGFLIVYLCLTKLPEIRGWRTFPWGQFYFYRIWRYTPTFYIVFLINWLLWPQMFSEPMWEYGYPCGNCSELWWQTMLYFGNFYGVQTNGCFGLAWYLAVDLQLYILSPVFIILLYRRPRVAFIGSGICVLASILYSGIAAHIHKINSPLMIGPAKPSDMKAMLELLHLYPFAHVAPFVVGLFAGYFVYKYRTTNNITKRENLIGWFLSLGTLLFVVYSPMLRGTLDDSTLNYNALIALYIAFSKFAWACAVGWIIFACAVGKGGFINSFLSWGPFIVLGRLVFSTYLIHTLISHIYFWTRRTLYSFSDIELMFTATSQITLSFAAAFIIAICVELPSCALQKILANKSKK